ncbi:hypothetical protein SSX86_023697 [Deinandra increscens subsp. villosa]|uniref:Uncharacterized protein n=1 Tax=Deinandra increscens subsp. villosa TaxID=3103831 RepID=A0AAP0CT22_9ASTR
MAANGGTTRDAAARRRRIAERGAERLALITGRVQSLSSPSSPPSATQSEPSSTSPCPTSVSPNSDQLHLTDENTDSLSNTETAGNNVHNVVGEVRSVNDNSVTITRTTAQTSFEPSNTETAGDDVVTDVRSAMNNSVTITRTTAQTSSEPDKLQSFIETLAEQTPPISTLNKSRKPESQTRRQATFSPKQLRPAITASENIRLICSVTVAVLVMLADAGFPFLSSDVIKNIILFRPLLLLLVTNVTIVAAHSLLQKVKHRSTGEAGFANHIGTVLEWALLMKTGSSALFMDCSVYSVVVICGMGFLQSFGW